ncbi:hypothetical protein NCER_102079 [Vairimorpha ceranae BRL01]|uniref:Uncharacterized protein n=1 Tax=Vairimorpha ceranae (strain BRL01) TaxID=578460 RepID=C4VBC8_VAIC1|nr:hypothetical protein NCER_102079 [Vairimorpha ceranae BRL01]
MFYWLHRCFIFLLQNYLPLSVIRPSGFSPSVHNSLKNSTISKSFLFSSTFSHILVVKIIYGDHHYTLFFSKFDHIHAYFFQIPTGCYKYTISARLSIIFLANLISFNNLINMVFNTRPTILLSKFVVNCCPTFVTQFHSTIIYQLFSFIFCWNFRFFTIIENPDFLDIYFFNMLTILSFHLFISPRFNHFLFLTLLCCINST